MKNYSFPVDDNKRMYISIYEHIKEDILKGNLAKDEKLPSKRILAKNLNVSINTIINAYDILVVEGYIYAKEKKGYFVSDFKGYDYKGDNITLDEKKKDEVEYLYDFTTSNIDYSLFPKSIFNSITKDIIYNEEAFYHRFDYKGSINLRNQIKKLLYEEKNISVDIKQIIIGENTHLLIEDIIKLLNTKEIMIESPGYYNENSFSAKVSLNHMDNKGFNTSEFSHSKATLGIITSFSQFPLGIKMPMDRKIELSNYLKESNKYIIEDSFDSSFRNNGYQTTPLFNLSNNVFFLESFSRTMFPGLCISYMVIPEKFVSKYDELFKVTHRSIPSLDQIILSKFIESGKYSSHVNRLRTSFLNKKKIILNNLKEDYYKIISMDNYSSILLELSDLIDLDALKDELKSKKIKINFINDFMKEKVKRNILILGFSSISMDILEKGLFLVIECIYNSLKENKKMIK